MVCGDGEIAEHVEDVTTADGDAVHRRDHGLGDLADQPMEVLHLEDAVLGGAVVARLGPLLLIAAGAEGLVACAGDCDDADAAIGPGALEREDELVDGATPERVVALGPLDRDPGQAPVDFVADVFQLVAFHGGILLRSASIPEQRPACDRPR